MATHSMHPHPQESFKYVEPLRFGSRPHYGLVVLAAVWLLAVGLVNLIYAIGVFADSDSSLASTEWIVGDARPEAWLMLCISLVQLAAVPALLLVMRAGFWIALASLIAHIVVAVMYLGESAAVGIALLALDVAILLSLLAGFGRARSAA